jgi:hypothetical protein
VVNKKIVPMKGSLKLRPRRALSRSEAWACFSANLALAGSGSLAAGYAIGYWQMAAVFLAMILSLLTAIPMLQWGIPMVHQVLSGAADAQPSLGEVWRYLHWPLASIALYVVSMLWAMATSLTILARTPKSGVPPRII